jgi:hypothetical protein
MFILVKILLKMDYIIGAGNYYSIPEALPFLHDTDVT